MHSNRAGVSALLNFYHFFRRPIWGNATVSPYPLVLIVAGGMPFPQNAVPPDILLGERRSPAFPLHYTTAEDCSKTVVAVMTQNRQTETCKLKICHLKLGNIYSVNHQTLNFKGVCWL